MPQAARHRDGERSHLKRISVACLVAACAAALSWAAAAAPAKTTQLHACDLYRALDRRCGCAGSENYLSGYGEKYCERFMRATGWSPAGLRWRAQTLACLQGEL